MQYMMLLFGDEATSPVPGTPEFGEMIGAYEAFGKEVTEAGVMVSGEALNPADTATTISAHNGKTETRDGPFVETKETLGGFYILDCKDLDEAIRYAAKIPAAKDGHVEIRPIMTFD